MMLRELGNISDRGPFFTSYRKASLAADTFALLVDLSDTAYPHKGRAGVVLLGFRIYLLGTAGSAGNATLALGVVKENDATDGTYSIIFQSPVTNYNGSFDSGWIDLHPFGANLSIESSAPEYAALLASGNETGLQNDAANLEDTLAGTTKSAGSGDLILHLDEGTDGGTYTIQAEALYGTV